MAGNHAVLDHEASHHHMSPIERLKALLSTERSDLLIVISYSVGIGVLSLAAPIGVQALVNTVAFGTVLQPLVILSILVAAALAISAMLQAFRTIVLEMVQRRVFLRLASNVTDVLLRARIETFDRQNGPELVNRFLDVVTVQKSFSILLIDGLTLVLQTLLGLILLGIYHPYLLAFDFALLLLILVILFPLGRGAIRTSIEESKAKYEVLSWLEDITRHPIIFRSQQGASYAVERADTLVRHYIENRASHFRILMRQIVSSLALQAFALASLLGVGGYLVVRGELTLGQLVAAELVLGTIVSSFAKFGKSLETFYDLTAALDKLGHILDLPTERPHGERYSAPAEPARLLLSDVSFSYDGNRRVLNHLNALFPAGSKIAIHGTGGQGKSALMDLLFGLRPADSGIVELDGIDYRDLRMNDVRNGIMLLRGYELFSGSVADNVRFGMDADLSKVRQALAQAGALDMLSSYPEGIQTELTSGGGPLSPSQSIRIMMARAILAKPRLLLIDEMLDHVDDLTTSGPLVRTLFAPDAPWTLVVATENPEIWSLFDKVYTLHGGRLTEEELPAGATSQSA
jgi:putative ABC transport system ATP-binding protein